MASKYNVYFVMNGGLPLFSPVYGVTEIPDLDDYIPYKSPTETYSYEFGGWYYDAECTTQALTGDSITSNTQLYALWIEAQIGGYSITFVANGGTPIPDNLTNQTAIPDPLPSLSRTGLTFDGWRWGNSSAAVAVVPGEPIYADATIYAKWIVNLYNITYNSNGGSAVSSNIGVTAFPSPLPTSTKAGYTFAGWWNSDYTVQYLAGQTINGSLTVYAKWIVNSYTVTWVENGGTPAPDDLTNVASLPSPLPIITKTGYELDGWYFNSLFTGAPATGGQLITQNETLYAKFVRKSYVINYELDGGSNNLGNPNEYNVESPTITLLNPSKVGYVFGGWFSDAEMTTAITSIPTGTTGDITIYALFTLSETGYSITWVENGGTPEQTDLTNQNYLPSVLPALIKTGYVFKGWFTNEALTIAATPGALIGENTTLYAKFEVQATPKKGYIRVEPIDTKLSATSKKPLQNKAIYRELNLKVDKVEGKSLVSDTEITHLEALDTQAELNIKFGAKEDIANKGVANGYAPLNASGIVDPIYVPGAYTDYVEYATYANLPATGVEGTLYVVIADETSGGNTSTYRWTGSVYVNVTDKLSASEVKALYESNANTNAYTDDEKSKLAGIEPNAEVNILEGIKVEGESDLAITDKKLTIPLATDTISGALDKVDKAYIDNVRNGTQSLPYDNTTSGLDSTTLDTAIDELNNIKLNSGIPYDRIIYMDENSVLKYIVPTRFEALTKTYNIKVGAGRFNMSWNNPTNRLWVFPEGTVLYSDGTTPIETSTAEKPDVIIPNESYVKLITSAWGGNYSLSDNNTDTRLKTKLSDLPALTYRLSLDNCSSITGSLSDLPALTYHLSLFNCSSITGSLSDLPALTYYLDLGNCSLIKGALSDLPALTYYLDLYNCSLITGSLSDLPALTYYLSLYNCSLITGSLSDLPALTYALVLYKCSLITGSLSDLPALTYRLDLTNCSLITGSYTAVNGENVPTTTVLTGTGLSATDMDNTLIAYAATTKNDGTFTAVNKNRTEASDDAVATLVARGWTINGLIKI